MECENAREAILESLLEPNSHESRAMIEAHVAECRSCAAFMLTQRNLDRQLTQHLRPPTLPPGFRTALLRRARQHSPPFWSDLLPDVVHFASCGVVTLLALVWLPLSAPVVLTAATGGTLLTHLVLTAVRESLDAAEDWVS
jgi:predicted anti-sigma-YlaC factor YlaD